MNPLWFLPMIMSVFGGIQQYKAGKEMENFAGEQERMAVENKRLADEETAEKVRRQDLKDKRLLGSARARAAASGVELAGTVSGYIDFMGETQSDELEWMKRAGASKSRLDLQAGMLQAKQTRLSAQQQKAGAFGSISQAASFGLQSGMFGPAPSFGGGSITGMARMTR